MRIDYFFGHHKAEELTVFFEPCIQRILIRQIVDVAAIGTHEDVAGSVFCNKGVLVITYARTQCRDIC